jgi:hypothetical protein
MRLTVRSFSFLAFIAVLFFTYSCKKKEDLSKAPSIEFISISPAQAKEFKDEIKIVISYLDIDGDLGENSPDTENLFVTDKRNGLKYNFRIQQLAPDNANAAIRGNLDVIMKHATIIAAGQVSEQVQYDIYVEDRQGNKSNTVTTSPITVTK